MKPYHAIVLFENHTFQCKGFDDPDEAARWVNWWETHYNSPLFRGYVIDAHNAAVLYVNE